MLASDPGKETRDISDVNWSLPCETHPFTGQCLVAIHWHVFKQLTAQTEMFIDFIGAVRFYVAFKNARYAMAIGAAGFVTTTTSTGKLR